MTELADLRQRIDELDGEIIRAVAERMKIVEAVAHFKKGVDMPVRQPDRIAAVSDRYAADGAASGLDAGFSRSLYAFLLDEAHRIEDAIIGTEAAHR